MSQQPKAVAWSGPLVGASFIAGLGGSLARSDHAYPRAGSSAEEIGTYFSQRAPWISVAGQTVSAVSLAAWTSAVARLTGRSRPLRTAAVAGGAIATAALGTSAACTAALAARPASEHAVKVHRAAFVAGGPTHGFGFGLLLGALGLSRRLPTDLSRAATIAAVPNLVSPAYLLWPPAVWTIPGGRFPGLIVTALAGVHLARG
jgi:hypothetical protein